MQETCSEHGGAIGAYVRVSSATQSVMMQRAAIERASAARGDRIDAWYVETWTGATMRRPEIARVLADVRAGNLRRLYVYRLDRITRSGIRDTLAFVDELRKWRCELVTLADGFSFDGPAAEVVLAVLAYAAQVERLAINERLDSARKKIEADGGHWGRPPRMHRAFRPPRDRRA